VRYWQSQYTVPVPMLITAHQGASPEAPLGEVPKDIAAASVAMPNVNLDTVFVTTVPHWFPVVLKYRKGKQIPFQRVGLASLMFGTPLPVQ
jgi:hypothetical protein